MIRLATALEDPRKTVVLVEADEELRTGFAAVFRARGHRVWSLENGERVIETIKAQRANCVILDLSIPGCSGLEVLKAIVAENPKLPVIAISSAGSITLAVDAMKSGASDFLASSFSLDDLISRVENCSMREDVTRDVPAEKPAFRRTPGMELLTSREYEVLVQIARGASSKEAGRCFGISPRTIDVHRARIKEKLQVRRAVDLVRVVYQAESAPEADKP